MHLDRGSSYSAAVMQRGFADAAYWKEMRERADGGRGPRRRAPGSRPSRPSRRGGEHGVHGDDGGHVPIRHDAVRGAGAPSRRFSCQPGRHKVEREGGEGGAGRLVVCCARGRANGTIVALPYPGPCQSAACRTLRLRVLANQGLTRANAFY